MDRADATWVMLVCVACLGFVELTRRQEPEALDFVQTLAIVTVFSALLWAVLG
jgi:hypothetical protein